MVLIFIDVEVGVNSYKELVKGKKRRKMEETKEKFWIEATTPRSSARTSSTP